MIEPAPTGVAAFLDRFHDGPVGQPTPINSLAEFTRTFGPVNDDVPGSLAVAQFFDNGGEQAWVDRVAHDPGQTMLEALVLALEDLRKVEFNLLCVPAAAHLDHPSPDARTPQLVTFAQQATRLCMERGAMLLLDPPSWIGDSNGMLEWVRSNPVADPNEALWFPALVREPAGPTTGTSGAIAGVVARTDRERGVWSAPAGVRAKLLGVRTAVELRRSDVEVLNQLGINSITNHQGGPVSWGARTLAGRDGGSSEWRYFPVRRLALHVEQSILQGLAWRSGEANSEELWARLRTEVAEFLESLFRAGALQGTRPREAFFVKCDSQTTSQADVERGTVRLTLGVAPLKPAEFVILNLEIRQQQPSGTGSLVTDAVAAALPHLRPRPGPRG